MRAAPSRTTFASDRWLGGLATNGQNWLIVVTKSMMPLIAPGDRVRVVPATASELHLGDLVVFWRDEKLLVHRYLGRAREARCLECGDFALRLGSFGDSDLVGRVNRIARRSNTIDLTLSPWPSLGTALGLGSRLAVDWATPLPFRRTAWRLLAGGALRLARTASSIRRMPSSRVSLTDPDGDDEATPL